jgi:L-cysteine/cystine lyase
MAVTREEIRARFPVLERYAYLNTGTCGPVSRATAAAVAERTRLDVEQGRGGLPYFKAVLDLRDRLRAALAALVGATPKHIALTYSTTAGCNIVVAGLGLGPDDEVVTTDEEHFGLAGPLAVSGARIRVARTRGRPAADAREAILAEVGPRTRLLALSHVSWQTGHVFPVHELRAETGLPVLVDGAQSVGAIAVEVGELDFYTVSGQKWLCGPDATGALYVRDPEALRIAVPSYFAQQGFEPEGTFVATGGAPRFDAGWLPAPALAGLLTAVGELDAGALEPARETAERCRALLAERVEVVTEPGHATLVTWKARGDAAAEAAAAAERGVIIRDLPGTGWLRASIGAWTDDRDLERLLELVDAGA